MTEARCDCTSSPPWPPMIRLHAGGPDRYYLCPACGAVREDIYRDRAIVARCWHDAPDRTLPKPVREEALQILQAPYGDQLSTWEE